MTLFDTSDYPKDHMCYSTDNKKVIGKFKDETNGAPIREFCGLRAKMYSILLSEKKNKATAKGVKKSVIKTLILYAALFGVSEDMKQTCSFNMIRSYNHQLMSVNLKKTSLCCYDDKRYVLDDNIHTLAHGHHKISKAL